MSINYDPSRKPAITRELLEFAREHNLHIVNIVCDEEGAKVGDPVGVSFAAAVPFLPRHGDDVRLQDGTICRVRSVRFVVTNVDGVISLMPNVCATRIQPAG